MKLSDKISVFYIICITLVMLSITGCVYTEGDDKAKQAFNLMTAQEKAMHDKVKKEFNEKAVMSVREAVRQRNVKPPQDSVPFIDIAGVIKHCNETILVPRDFWNKESSIEEADRAKFSSQDRQWYRKIVKKATGENYVEPPIKSKPISVTEIKEQVKRQVQEVKKSTQKTVEVNEYDLLPLNEYDDIRFMARGCDSAIAIVDKAASQTKPLTIQDKVDITYQKSICETRKLNDNL